MHGYAWLDFCRICFCRSVGAGIIIAIDGAKLIIDCLAQKTISKQDLFTAASSCTGSSVRWHSLGQWLEGWAVANKAGGFSTD